MKKMINGKRGACFYASREEAEGDLAAVHAIAWDMWSAFWFNDFSVYSGGAEGWKALCAVNDFYDSLDRLYNHGSYTEVCRLCILSPVLEYADTLTEADREGGL